MTGPKYGAVNSSQNNLEQQFIKTNSDNKSLGFEVDSFNWEEEENQAKGNINLGQYDDEDKECYDDDFEDEQALPVKTQKQTPKHPSPVKKVTPQKQEIDEYDDIPEDFDDGPEVNKETQIKEIAELIEIATRSANNAQNAQKKNPTNSINELLSMKNKTGSFQVDQIIAERSQNNPKTDVLDPFKRMGQNKQALRSYKDARFEKQQVKIFNFVIIV